MFKQTQLEQFMEYSHSVIILLVSTKNTKHKYNYKVMQSQIQELYLVKIRKNHHGKQWNRAKLQFQGYITVQNESTQSQFLINLLTVAHRLHPIFF